MPKERGRLTHISKGEWALHIEPRRWQSIALELWEENSRGVVSVVTGGGKTLFAFICMLSFRSKYKSPSFIIVVPTITLLDQWYVSLQEDLNVAKEEIACFSSQEKSSKLAVVNLMVINTARQMAGSMGLGKEGSFLIVDECHRAGSPVNAQALSIPHTASLGLSATPEREYDRGFQELVVPALGEIIYSYDYKQAFEDGVVSPFELINVRTDLLPDEKRKFDALTVRAAREFRKIEAKKGSEERLKRVLHERAAVSASATMRIPVAAKLVEHHKGQRTIVFHERVEAANKIAEVLASRKHSVTIYHSQIGPVIRRDNLRLYRRGVFDVLVCCRALDEGMNVPETTVAIIASSTSSSRQRIQRLGRVLRPASGKTVATIYTIYATSQERNRLLREEENLVGVASVTWSKGIVKHGENPG